jgi:hypothetical protein
MTEVERAACGFGGSIGGCGNDALKGGDAPRGSGGGGWDLDLGVGLGV